MRNSPTLYDAFAGAMSIRITLNAICKYTTDMKVVQLKINIPRATRTTAKTEWGQLRHVDALYTYIVISQPWNPHAANFITNVSFVRILQLSWNVYKVFYFAQHYFYIYFTKIL